MNKENTEIKTYASVEDWLNANPLRKWRFESAQSLPAPVDSEPVRPSVPQADVGDRLDVTRSAVSLWETGETMPKYEYVEQLAGIIGTTAIELFQEWHAWRNAKPSEVQPVAV